MRKFHAKEVEEDEDSLESNRTEWIEKHNCDSDENDNEHTCEHTLAKKRKMRQKDNKMTKVSSRQAHEMQSDIRKCKATPTRRLEFSIQLCSQVVLK